MLLFTTATTFAQQLTQFRRQFGRIAFPAFAARAMLGGKDFDHLRRAAA